MSSLKIFLLWLLMAVLPVQGYAAIAVPACASSQRVAAARSAAVETPRAQMDIHATHAHGARHEHEAPCSKDSGASTSAVCHACCAAAALLPSGLDWLLPQAEPLQPEATPDILFSGHIAAGLERPPRFS